MDWKDWAPRALEQAREGVVSAHADALPLTLSVSEAEDTKVGEVPAALVGVWDAPPPVRVELHHWESPDGLGVTLWGYRPSKARPGYTERAVMVSGKPVPEADEWEIVRKDETTPTQESELLQDAKRGR